VVDFGCFVDIGMHDSGLVHVSRLADRYIRDPHDLVAVGDVVRVWVVEVDKQRRRVSLTMVPPGTERPKHPRHVAKPAGGKPAGEKPAGEKPAGEKPAGEKPAGEKPAGEDGPPRRDRQHGHGRPPRDAGQRRGSRPPRSQGHDRPKPHGPPPQPKPRPKPLIPITEAMKEGKEPLRTFGDLVQFYQQKEQLRNDRPEQVVEPTQLSNSESPPAAQDGPSV